MKIRMYNVGFGDCFCLRDRNKRLLVDFGTSNARISGLPRCQVFDMVISDLTTIEHKNLLLTHFHLDHLSGLLYMVKKRSSSYDFQKIYLPDVFSEKWMSRILVLLLLADMVKNSYLPSRQISLLALVEALQLKPQTVELLARSSVFEGKYQALWPDMNIIKKEAMETSACLWDKYESTMEKLEAFSEKIRRIVWMMTEAGRESEAENSTLQTSGILEKELREIRGTVDFQELVRYINEEKISLRQFKNKISIVFQNQRDGEQNLLFTGDVTKEHMQMIADNYDGKLPLYEEYWCIKVPHHGTQSHYFDFSPYMPENMLISNGLYHANSKQKAKENRISAQYGGLFYIRDAHMYCSECDNCDACHDECSCKERTIIGEQCYLDI